MSERHHMYPQVWQQAVIERLWKTIKTSEELEVLERMLLLAELIWICSACQHRNSETLEECETCRQPKSLSTSVS